jgi:formylglycine-generating enzyme required for sulfatase activity
VLENSKLGRGVYTLLQLASGKADKKREEAQKIISEAKLKFKDAILNHQKKMRESSPEKLCDEAVRGLKAFLNDPERHLSPRTIAETKALIAEIEAFRGKLFQGPSTGNMWKLPVLDLEMLPVSKGTFSYKVSLHDDDHETKPRRVTLSSDYWIGRSEVTIGQFLEFLKSVDLNRNDRRELLLEINFHSGDCPILKGGGMKRGKGKTWGKLARPMVMVSWRGAVMFCEWLTKREQKAGRLPKGYVYRLPTEAEWEYACLAGRQKTDPAKLDEVAWFRENSDNRTHEVCTKQVNPWGMYDMEGNVWEWCYDWYAERRNTLDATDPSGPTGSDENGKVIKGGSFVSRVPDLMPLSRFFFDYKRGKKNIGFRIVCAREL